MDLSNMLSVVFVLVLVTNKTACAPASFHKGHDQSLHHVHDFEFASPEEQKYVQLQYNVTKCDNHRYIELTTASSFVYKSAGDVLIHFNCPGKFVEFLRTISPGAILFSHYSMRCAEKDRPFLLRVETIEPCGKGTNSVEIHGEELQPFELFKHADLSFESNVLEMAGHENFGTINMCENEQASTHWDVPEPNDEPFSWLHALSPFSAARARPANRTTLLSSGAYSSGPTQQIRPVKPWHIAFPNRPLHRQNVFRWMCSSCNITIFPTVRFQLQIDNYKLRKLTIVVEGTLLLSMSPELRIDSFYTRIKRTIASYSWMPLYVTVGGIPFEIQPKVRLNLRILALVNVVTPLRFTAIFGGSFEGGVQYTEPTGLTTVGASNFVAVPKDYLLHVGKTFAAFTGPIFNDIDVYDCAAKCTAMAACSGFKYQNSQRHCTLTTSRAEIRRSTDRSTVWTFEKHEWELPTFHPTLTGAIRPMLQPIITLDINRVGGPVVSFASATAIVFFKADQNAISLMEMHGLVYFYLGGLIYIRIGSRKIFNKELLPELYRATIYKVQALQKFSISRETKPMSNVPELPEASYFQSRDAFAEWINETLQRKDPATGLSTAESILFPSDSTGFDDLLKISFVGFCSAGGLRIRVNLAFHVGGAEDVTLQYESMNTSSWCTESATFRISRRIGELMSLEKIFGDACEQACPFPIPDRLHVLRGENANQLLIFQYTSVCTAIHLRKGSSIEHLQRGEGLWKGTSLVSATQAMRITESGKLKIDNLETGTAITKEFKRPAEALVFNPDGKILVTDEAGRALLSLNSRPLQSAGYLTLKDSNVISVVKSSASDEPIWSTLLNGISAPAKSKIVLKASSPFVLKRNEGLYPGESLLGDFSALCVEDSGLTLFSWEDDFDRIERTWQSERRDVETLIFTEDGRLQLIDIDGSTIWASSSANPMAKAVKVSESGILFFSDVECANPLHSETFEKHIMVRKSSRLASWMCRLSGGARKAFFRPFRRTVAMTNEEEVFDSHATVALRQFHGIPMQEHGDFHDREKTLDDGQYSDWPISASCAKALQTVENFHSTAEGLASSQRTFSARCRLPDAKAPRDIQHVLRRIYAAYPTHACRREKYYFKQNLESACGRLAREIYPGCQGNSYGSLCNMTIENGARQSKQGDVFSPIDVLYLASMTIFLLWV